ncbi:MAG: cytochrome c biogenesis protein CcsA [bacterium]|nr:cytochrome C assembly protein [Deltaproteobacteria bacterium]MCP4907264.1 cytochrome c biogenesis protein CcsA [bacterium]
MTTPSPSTAASPDRIGVALRLLGWIVLGLMPIYAWTVIQAPTDSVQGIMQKILYVHPPLAYGAYLGFVTTAVGGGLFLWRGREHHDQLAIAGAEVGTLFCTLMLITGPIWARGAWGPGNWWVWDARLTLTLLLWFVYLAYLLLRSFTEGDERTARFASIYGILGVVLIPLNYWIIDLVGGAMHPDNIEFEGEAKSLGEGMGLPFFLGNLTLFVVFAYLLVLRWRVGLFRVEAEALGFEMESGGV